MSDDKKILRLADDKFNGHLCSPEDILKLALNDIGKEGALKSGKKILVIGLDDSKGKFNVTWYQGGMVMSQVVSLLEFSKMRIFAEMDAFDGK